MEPFKSLKEIVLPSNNNDYNNYNYQTTKNSYQPFYYTVKHKDILVWKAKSW